MKKTYTFAAENAGIGQAIAWVEETLISLKMKDDQRRKAVLTAEEAFGSLVKNTLPGGESKVHVSIKTLLGNVVIEMSAPGEEYALEENMKSASLSGDEDMNPDTQDVIRNILLRSLGDDLKYHHKRGINSIRMTLVHSRHAFLLTTLLAMTLAVIVGLILTEVGAADFNKILDTDLLVPIKTMYVNALKMVVAPVVFFSIISCIVEFSSLKELGRIGGKVMGMYLFTTIVAVFVGLGAFYLLQPGNAGMKAMASIVDPSSITGQTMNVSLQDTIVGIVPGNFVKPFLDSNMLQLIFMAVLCGVACGLIGKYSETLKNLFKACNELFLKVATIIIKALPLAVFCSITSMMLEMGVSTLFSVCGMFATFLLGLICMMAVYCLLMVILGRLNPLHFLRKYFPTMLQVLSMASSNASIPLNMEACEKRIGIDRKIYSFSIPLGATVNMDGSCVYMAVFALTLAKIYNVQITGSMILTLVLSIVILSVGAPGIPGSGLICLSVLLTQMGVPVEAIGLVMGIDPLVGMFRCMSNCLGDVAVSTVVAKGEGKLDMSVYKS